MKKRYLVVGIFIIFAIITYLDRNSISDLGSAITGELGLNDKQWGLIMAGICMIMGSFIENINIAIIFLSLGLAFKDFTLPVAWAVATDIGGKNAGTVAGTMGLAGQLGSAIMASTFGYILHSMGSYEIPVRIIGCLVIVGGLLWLKIDASKPIAID